MAVDDVSRAALALAGARRLLVLTGAGVSTESGIPDFRSPGGLWTRFSPDEFHYDRFLADPARFWRLRAELMAALDLARVRPNATHVALADAEASGRLLGVVTQNIDGLHARAGTSEARLVEIHGSAARVRCIACDGWFPLDVAADAVARGALPPACPACAGILKPGTVLFGEPLPEEAYARASAWAASCDALLVVGSSLAVWPAAGLVPDARERGARLVIANREATPFDAVADHVLRGAASATVPRLLREAGLLPPNG